MEMSVRVILLGVAFVIIAGIIWDAVRNRKEKLSTPKLSTTRRNKYEPNPDEPNFLAEDELLEDSVVVRGSPAFAPISSSMPVTVIDRTRGDLTGKKSTVTKTAYPAAKPTKSKTTHQNQNQSVDKNDIVVLHVLSKKPNIFKGKSLKSIFDELHLKYGDMNIFHSHEHMDGSGGIVFSIASAIEPGYFEMESLENLETPGLVFFFTSCQPNQSIGAFELMYRTAKQIALRLGGEVMDDTRKPITSQKIEQYRERLRGQSVAV